MTLRAIQLPDRAPGGSRRLRIGILCATRTVNFTAKERFYSFQQLSQKRNNPHTRLIKLATYPAPKPLSIFTTLTFEAQEFIIPSSAATP